MSELQRLRDQVGQLEDALGIKLQLPNDWGLTPLEMKIVGLLARREIVSQEMIFAALYAGRHEADQPQLKTVEVHMCKVRRKLRPRGLKIKTHYGVGYYTDGKTRAALKSLGAA